MRGLWLVRRLTEPNRRNQENTSRFTDSVRATSSGVDKLPTRLDSEPKKKPSARTQPTKGSGSILRRLLRRE